MFGVVSHYGKVIFARCDADEQVEILNGLANGLQPDFLAAKCVGNVVNAHDVVIVRQQPRLCQFLLTIANGGIIGSVEQFDSGNGRDAAELVVLHTELAHMLIAAQQLDAGRSVEEVFQFGHDLELGIGVCGTSGTYLCHDFAGGALVFSPPAEELVHLLCYTLTTGGLGLGDAFCQTARQGKTLTRREALGLGPYIVY